ncbi:MAG TPA: TlpA disulfide reductase family protein [Micromonosporaceae bacterium]|nr:TlpA disulfide reductase family protein [Micromonosporaceae bacterium]
MPGGCGTRLLATLFAASVILAGCGGDPEPARSDLAAAWFQPCPGPAEPGARSRAGQGAPPKAGSGSPMPSEPLPCLEGGDRVDLATPSGVPTVVTVWASWCAPCRQELPAFQRYAEAANGQLRVLGVVSGDTRQAATALARELGVRFPTLYDRSGRLMKRLGRTALPVTLFIAPDGGLAHLYNGTPLTGAALSTLTERQLGVVIAA